MAVVMDSAWLASVCAVCDPICESANVGFVRQISTDAEGGVRALLWEAEPVLFADRYPDSGIVDSYGPEQWPPPCIDYWIYLDPESCAARFSVEGLEPDDVRVQLTGVGDQDGRLLGQVLSRILRVAGPSA